MKLKRGSANKNRRRDVCKSNSKRKQSKIRSLEMLSKKQHKKDNNLMKMMARKK